MSAQLRATLERALRRRAPLRTSGETTAFRWVNGEADGLPGVTVDLFADVAVVSGYGVEELHPVAEAAAGLVPLRAAYAKHRPKEARTVERERDLRAPRTPSSARRWRGDIREGGLAYRIRPTAGLAVGLYLDMREARSWVQAQARGRTVLNCSASPTPVARGGGGAGGAARVVNVDPSRRALAWGKKCRLNGRRRPSVASTRRGRLRGLRRLARRNERFDLLILDPRVCPERRRHLSPPPGTGPGWPRPQRRWWLPRACCSPPATWRHWTAVASTRRWRRESGVQGGAPPTLHDPARPRSTSPPGRARSRRSRSGRSASGW